MTPKIGVDIVNIPKFEKSVEKQGEKFLLRIFLEQELSRGVDAMHLGGIFAAKEAIMKALSMPAGSWLKISVTFEGNGRPKVQFLDDAFSFSNYDLSISHDGEYAIAIFIIA